MVGEAFAGLSVVLEANPEPGAQSDTKLVRFANIRLGIIGDRSLQETPNPIINCRVTHLPGLVVTHVPVHTSFAPGSS
jgi:hypothetical protein